MNFININKDEKKVILLIHPMLFTSEAIKSLIADKMPKDSRIIIPEMAGHGRSKESFLSVEIEGEKIYAYLVDEGIGEID
ncbi:hypothetical protein VLK81_00220 [Citroniella saccharovorans]|uniref:Alpha/beta hydrolase n=1 Tax=Citroniella saccharovorans TaxID=2053367 RepID=A0AAW9MVG7_9FIRM|nr:hypothetical protein [Citroniella saccharovorans]MEB3428482.1 hypothetical protein [Citroniella saccharovorans]